MTQMDVQKQVWVDTDITIGRKSGLFSYCDVDDGYALTALLRSPQVEVIGVSSTLGNTSDIDVSTTIARQFISRFGPNSVPVFKGAAQKLPDDSSHITTPEAVEQLAATLKENRVTILCIGAATNIAILLLKYPELISRIDELVLVAGRRSLDQHFVSGHWQPRPFRDLNFEYDVRAFQLLLESTLNVTLVPYEACNQLWLRPHDLIQLAEVNKVGRYLSEHSLGWLAEWEAAFGADGFNPFDLVAAGYVIRPENFSFHEWNVVIESGPSDTEKGENKPYLICSEDVRSERRVRYCTDVDDTLKPFLMERIGSHDMSAFVLGMSHINIIVPDIEQATEYYRRVLGFEQAIDQDGSPMDYQGVEMKPFALDAGLLDGRVNVDVRFLKHPQASLYLELMTYHNPRGNQQLPTQPRTFDIGGPRHIALEVSNCNEVFRYLKDQEGVTMINTSNDYHPIKLDGFPITFFYWVDRYGIQWEMEEGRRVGVSHGIV